MELAHLSRLLRRPGYPGFVVTVSLSRIAATMFTVSGVLLVLARTGSAPLAGATAAASVLPGALTGPFLGAWLDVARRRRVLIVFDQLTSILALLLIVALAGHAPGWTLPAVAVIYSVTRPLSSGSFFSAIAELAGAELLDHASAIEATSLNLSFVIGPALAGALSGADGPATAIYVQVALTAIVAILIAINPAFERRPPERAENAVAALRDGFRIATRDELLRATALGSTLAASGWGLMVVGFPLYAARTLHAGAHAGGYLWAAMAFGSILGTFGLAGTPSRRRVAISYSVLGCSALLWLAVDQLWLGLVLICLTGFLEGPAYSGTIALRQRHIPPVVRAQVMITFTSVALVAGSAGTWLGGLVKRPLPAIVAFVAINQLAALSAAGVRWRGLHRDRAERVPQE